MVQGGKNGKFGKTGNTGQSAMAVEKDLMKLANSTPRTKFLRIARKLTKDDGVSVGAVCSGKCGCDACLSDPKRMEENMMDKGSALIQSLRQGGCVFLCVSSGSS